MLIECKKIVKWKNGGIAFDEVRWRKELEEGDSIIGSQASRILSR